MRKKTGPKAYWKKVAKGYAKVVGETGDRTHSKIVNPIVSDFLGSLKGKVVLDAGCGNGYWSRRLAKEAKEVIGVDFTEELIEIAKTKPSSDNLKFQVGDLKDLKFPANEFDTVLCNMVLMDVNDLDKVIGELARVLKIGGRLVISIIHPCFENPPNTYSLKNKKGEQTAKVVKHYFRTGPVEDTTRSWDEKHPYLHWHHIISDYLNSFSKHKLFIEETSEPNESDMMADDSYSHAPYILIFKIKKIE